jgi:hypothetical protein
MFDFLANKLARCQVDTDKSIADALNLVIIAVLLNVHAIEIRTYL